MFTNNEIITLFQTQWNSPDFNRKDIDLIFNGTGGISALEGVLFYLYILKTRPRHVIEFSPNHGYSSLAIALGQRAKRNKYSFGTFDIQQRFCDATEKLMREHQLEAFCEVVCGDALIKIPKYIKRKRALVDFVFIDSDHGASFANRYINELFPLFEPNCLIGVHDIAAQEHTKDGKSEFKTSLLGGLHSGGEENPVRNFIQNNKKNFCVLHSVTGGRHEGANLNFNDKLYNKILEISGYDFRQAKSPPCPKTLFFVL